VPLPLHVLSLKLLTGFQLNSGRVKFTPKAINQIWYGFLLVPYNLELISGSTILSVKAVLGNEIQIVSIFWILFLDFFLITLTVRVLLHRNLWFQVLTVMMSSETVIWWSRQDSANISIIEITVVIPVIRNCRYHIWSLFIFNISYHMYLQTYDKSYHYQMHIFYCHSCHENPYKLSQ
jgi:hypothetical protein